MRRIFKKKTEEKYQPDEKVKQDADLIQGCCKLSVQIYSFQSVFIKMLTSALFWDIMWCIVVIQNRRFGKAHRYQLRGSRIPSGHLKMGLICFPETSI